MARGSDGPSLAVCASEQPGRYGADTGGAWRCGMVVACRLGDLVRLHQACDLMNRDNAMPLGVPALARTAFMSPGHCSRSVRAAFGEMPHSYLLDAPDRPGQGVPRRGDLQVTEVCTVVGYIPLGSFSSWFTELVGDSPSADRARRHPGLRGQAPPATGQEWRSQPCPLALACGIPNNQRAGQPAAA